MASSSSSSSVILQHKYDVFLSFRGDDTRDNFTSHLYAALCQKQIQTFIDDDGLKRGDEISPVLLKAIEESKVSVIIFSKDYASSKWCLDELVKILECKKINGQMVLPVFYHITPSDVRKQTGSFKDAFVRHEKQFKKIPEKVRRWRAALTEASNLSGWDSMVIRPESKLVGDIVKEILKKLNEIAPSSDCEGLVGIDSHMDHIKSLLCIEFLDFRIIGIWGMGGVGKTTIAGALFNQISYKFDSSCFISNVREESEKWGLVHLRKQVLSQILEEENLTIGTPNIPQYIKKRLQRKKVFIVFDDVNDLGQLEFMTAGLDQFGPGSRVIVTTRDKQVLCNYGVDTIYEVEGFKYPEALQLFSNFAFKQKCPLEEFLELSNDFVDYAKGNPLALKVLGSSLYRKTKGDWMGVLNKIRRISNPKIDNVLKIGYHGLDFEVQDIFLDIACFFKGYDSNYAKEILSSCYLSIEVGFSTLIDKSLVTISDDNMLEMHNLLQEMGQEIIRQESFNEPGKRSRLWNHEDVFHVLKNNTGTDAVQGLFLDMSKIRDLHLSSGAFEKMPNLKFLKFFVSNGHIGDIDNINKVHLPQGINYLPSELRYLCWYGYPLKTLPSNFSPKNLIEIDLRFSNVDEQLWVEKKLGSDVKLIEPNHLDAPERGQSLLHFPSSIQCFTNLRRLKLYGCKSLKSFPGNIHFRSLIYLNVSYCINLTRPPQISGNIKEIYLTGTAIDEVPSSIACLPELESLQLWKCERLKSFPRIIYKLKSLRSLSLWRHRITKSQLLSSIECWKEFRHLSLGFCNIMEIPEDLCSLSSLEDLTLSGNEFESLPTSIKQLSKLRSLCLSYCNKLRSIPELPLAVKSLSATGCGQLQSLAEFPLKIEELGEPELEILSEKVFELCESEENIFNFTNCLKLNQDADNYNILRDSQQRIQNMATTAIRLCYEKVFDKIRGISLCLPGNEIPKWFSHQNSGTSITIKLPQHCCNKRFIGFSLSAIVTLDKSYYEDFNRVGVICTYKFANNVEFKWSCIDYYSKNVLIESDHIVLGYTPCIDRRSERRYTTASFEFTPYNFTKKARNEFCKIKCCGVHPLYVQSNIIQPDASIQRFTATSEDLMETMVPVGGVFTELPDAKTSENDRIPNEEEGAANAKKYCSLRGTGLLLCSSWTFITSLILSGLIVFYGCWSFEREMNHWLEEL